MSQPESNNRLFHITRVALSLTAGFIIAWIAGAATWNVHWIPGVPLLKGGILLLVAVIGYTIMDRRIMGASTQDKVDK
ncbi:MAG: hypothetical protein ACKVQS_08900 [Fimbriimonadaceae bacterium]